MTNPSPFARRSSQALPTLPRGEVVSTFETYPEAQNAVDVLARADFPVARLSIIGSDLKTVERVTGKMTYGRASLAGALSGAWLGVFFGLLMFILAPANVSLAFVAAAVLIGAGFGVLFGVVTYSVNRRRRDFTSTMQVIASSYQVLVDGELVNRARNLLAAPDGAEPAPAPAAPEAPAADDGTIEGEQQPER